MKTILGVCLIGLTALVIKGLASMSKNLEEIKKMEEEYAAGTAILFHG